MKYLCLIYYDEKQVSAMPDDVWNAFVGECLASADALRGTGHLLAGEALEPVSTATTVRVQNGKVSVTDGPFAETKEQLAGFVLVEARDLNEAIQVASRFPPARLGGIEVRPIRELSRPDTA